LNLEVGKWPAFAIQDTTKNTKYPFDQTKKITSKDISEFVDKFSSGTIKPSIKSEPTPESQDGPVTIVVANNYDEVVLDDTKDVLIEFYAPWCGHCKALAPKYDELGEKFKAFSDKVTIAKVDATLNDVPDDIQGFPTIKLYAAGKKSDPITYTGSRTIEDLAAFVKSNGKYEVDVDAKESAAEAAPVAASDAPVVQIDDDIHDEL
jgi:protein disulfide-isomerase A1